MFRFVARVVEPRAVQCHISPLRRNKAEVLQEMTEFLTRWQVLADASRLLAALRAKRPLVHNITNLVAMDVSANVLLAIGASPAMVHAGEEVAEFAGLADALVVNTGTLSRPFADSMLLAAREMNRLGKPWVLDPVGAGAMAFRNGVLGDLLALKPAVIRGNASEILAMGRIAGLGGDSAAPRGVDSQHTTAAAEAMARLLARHNGGTVAATGAVDFITDGSRAVRLGNGDAMMARVTALGCALSAVCAGFAAVAEDGFAAALAAVAVYGVAGEMAGLGAGGPGSFRAAFLDRLFHIGGDDLEAGLKVLP